MVIVLTETIQMVYRS